MVKPQFEIKGDKNKQGKIKDEILVNDVIRNIKKSIENEGYNVIGTIESPILGKKGKNKEYLMYLSF